MGNCLDRIVSDEGGEESSSSSSSNNSSRQRSQNRSNRHSRNHGRRTQNNYTRLNGNTSSSSSLVSLVQNQDRITSQNQNINQNYNNVGNSVGSFQTTNGSSIFLSPASSMSDSLQIGSVGASLSSSFNQQYNQTQQVFYLTPNVQRTADQLTEEEQIKLLKRMTLIQQLPSTIFDENKKHKECVICMIDFELKDSIKCLPCMHTFHQSCIDSWLVRSLICPSCMEPVDAGLLSAYENE